MELCSSCNSSSFAQTHEAIVCMNCGVVQTDLIFENELSFEQISDHTNPIFGNGNGSNDVHPTINITLSRLSKEIIIPTESRIQIIKRAYELRKAAGNYIIATEMAFHEKYPYLDIDTDVKKIEKIEHEIEESPECHTKCVKNCRNSYNNNYLINKKKKINKLIERNKKKDKTIKQLSDNVKINRKTLYNWKKVKYRHITKDTKEKLLNRSKKITYEISNFIEQHPEKTLEELKTEILYLYYEDIGISTISDHKRKLEVLTTI